MGYQRKRAGSLGTSCVGRMRAAEARACQGSCLQGGAAISQGTPLHAVGRLWVVSAASLVQAADLEGCLWPLGGNQLLCSCSPSCRGLSPSHL